jgi:hypothetical protein
MLVAQLIHSQLSDNLPLLLMSPDYAIYACIFKAIRGAPRYRIGEGQSRKSEGKLRK